MDLSYASQEHGAVVTALPTALAVLMAVFVARQAASRTAQINALLIRTDAGDALTTPADGAFNGGVAAALTAWLGE
ncbi:hypothetical protein KY084_04155 [Stakelama sp. CBK3Z-3]|uniref:Uncharacterized protein n=1 Tax=Stakelama flava TaxID=2860338 RepID=A0ABS6XIQ4_9SPHN|nr:hypothetical protein [Stakelama flava]MBW4330065.1 hypothetical protein [Stakelama flava]